MGCISDGSSSCILCIDIYRYFHHLQECRNGSWESYGVELIFVHKWWTINKYLCNCPSIFTGYNYYVQKHADRSYLFWNVQSHLSLLSYIYIYIYILLWAIIHWYLHVLFIDIFQLVLTQLYRNIIRVSWFLNNFQFALQINLHHPRIPFYISVSISIDYFYNSRII